jgi:hypothetical protein
MDLGAEPTARTAQCLILLLSLFARGAAMRSDDGRRCLLETRAGRRISQLLISTG